MNLIFKKNHLIVVLHVVLWLLVFLWPLLSLNDSSQFYRIIIRNWLPTLCILLVFYFNYFVLVDWFFFKNKKNLFFVLNVLLVIAAFIVIKFITPLFNIEDTTRGIERVRRINGLRRGVLPNIQYVFPMVLSIGMCLGIKINKRWNTNALQLEKIKQSQLDSEIKYLRHQIQPHFLFNTLNNIYSLIDSAPKTAKTSVHSLSKMMRYLLHEAVTDRVPLSKEIDFIERYIKLMQLRTSNNLTLKKEFPVINQPIQIAPLLLITFIENAFKHGIHATQKSYILISLTINNNELCYTVKNSSFPEKSKVTDSGVGLNNFKKRLELLYNTKFELTEYNEKDIHIAKLVLNLS